MTSWKGENLIRHVPKDTTKRGATQPLFEFKSRRWVAAPIAPNTPPAQILMFPFLPTIAGHTPEQAAIIALLDMIAALRTRLDQLEGTP